HSSGAADDAAVGRRAIEAAGGQRATAQGHVAAAGAAAGQGADGIVEAVQIQNSPCDVSQSNSGRGWNGIVDTHLQAAAVHGRGTAVGVGAGSVHGAGLVLGQASGAADEAAVGCRRVVAAGGQGAAA